MLSDLDIGMNDWVCRDLKWDDSYRARPRQGARRRRSSLKLEKFYRYVDKDDDGIAVRTLPGVHPKGAYFTRGSGHNQFGAYTEDSDRVSGGDRPAAEEMGDREAARAARRSSTPTAARRRHRVASAAATARCARRSTLLEEQGVGVDYMRVRGFPFSEDVEQFLAAHELLFVVEQNRDAQLRSLLTARDRGRARRSCARCCTTAACRSPARFIVEGVLAAQLRLRTPESRPMARAAMPLESLQETA